MRIRFDATSTPAIGHSPIPARKRTGAALVNALIALLVVTAGTIPFLIDSGTERSATSSFVNDTVIDFGPEVMNGSPGGTNYIEEFETSTTEFRLHQLVIRNGTSGGANRATSVIAAINGHQLVPSGEVTSSDYEKVFDFAAMGTDTLEVTVTGSSGSYATVSIISGASPDYIVDVASLKILTDTTLTLNVSTVRGIAAPPYRLYIYNGQYNSEPVDPVNGRLIRWANDTVAGPSEINASVKSAVVTTYSLPDTIPVRIELHGPNGSGITFFSTARDTANPVITVAAPADSSVTAADSITVSGEVSDQTLTQTTVNGLPSDQNGSLWERRIALIEGWNTITILTVDAAGNSSSVTRYVRRDSEAPVLTVASPGDSTGTRNASVSVSGTVVDATDVTVATNGTPLTVVGTSYSGSVSLTYGLNTLTTTATDAAGNTDIVVRTVWRDTLPPVLAVAAPTDSTTVSTDSITVSGTISDETKTTVMANGIGMPISTGNFSGKVPLTVGVNAITVIATDLAANADTVVRHVTRTGDSLPPDPSTVAPALSATGGTSFADGTSFLYTGSNPIQTGVSAGTIRPQFSAVIRGRVLDRSGAPISGVTVSIKDHAEFGQTLSRADGWYDMAINGGAPRTVSFAKTGLLPVQRTVETPWRDYVMINDVAMIALDTAMTVVDLTDSTSVQVATSSISTDVDGSRQVKLFFRQGTNASLVLPNDSIVPIDTLHVRATEFTVGPSGPAAMPAELPQSTQYTYAVELSIDQALAQNARSVEFDQPLPVYVDNFLGISAGQYVPVGYFDRQRGVWVPSADALTIKILSVGGGYASLDITGSDSAASYAELEAIGIDSTELQTLAAQYTTGKTLWRTRVTHFTPYDFNLPPVPPPGPPPPPEDKKPDQPPIDDSCKVGGSIIECQNRILGQTVPITGTPYTLNYRSDRMVGNVSATSISVPITGDSIPATLAHIEVMIDVAGVRTDTTLLPLANQRYDFAWDRLDAYGRTIQGAVTAKITRTYVFTPITYWASSTQIQSQAGRWGLNCSGDGPGPNGLTACSTSSSRELNYRVPTEWTQTLGILETAKTQGIGGWTLSDHHMYDVGGSGTLHLGSGERITGARHGAVWRSIAGNGPGFSGDNGPATEAQLAYPHGLAWAPDGSMYISDSENRRIRRIDTAGVITTVAGTGGICSSGGCGDGGAATSATFATPTGLALAADGSLLIADAAAKRVRKIRPDGIIETFAGTGDYNTESEEHGDGGLATAAELYYPHSLLVRSDGTVLIADLYGRKIRIVQNDLTIATFAGTGVGCNLGADSTCGDNGAATQAPISPLSLATGPDGGFYVAEDDKIRLIDRAGVIRRIVGAPGASCTGNCGDGGPALSAALEYPSSLTSTPNGELIFVDNNTLRIVDTRGIVSRIAQAELVFESGGLVCAYVYGQPLPYNDVWTTPACGAAALQLRPDGTLILVSGGTHRIIEITPAMPGFSLGDFSVVAPDQSEIYVFDATGRHLQTREALTRKVTLQMTYDGAGRLIGITDSTTTTATTTSIVRDGSGTPTHIIGHFNDTTRVQLDGNGYLHRLIGPIADSTTLVHTATGLVTSLTNPRGFQSTYTFGSDGRLVSNSGPTGSGFSITKSDSTDGYLIEMESAMERLRKYQIKLLDDGTEQRLFTDPSGLVTTTDIRRDGSIVTTTPTNMVVTSTEVSDPTLGPQAKRLRSSTLATPGGKILQIEIGRGATLSNPADPSSVISSADTVSVNGKAYTTSYNRATSTYITTTPGGQQTTIVVDSAGNVVSEQVGDLATTQYGYDTFGRLTTISRGGREISYHYSGNNLTSIVDALNRVTTFGYDAAGRTISRIDPDSAATAFAYDKLDNLTSIVPPGRPAHTFTYDSTGMATSYTPPGTGGSLALTYNADAELVSIALPDTTDITASFDGSHRLTTLSTSSGVVTSVYDSTGTLSSMMSLDSVSIGLTYDGRLPTSESWSGPVNGTVTIGYNNDLLPTTVAVAGATTTYSYDNDGLVQSASYGIGSLSFSRNGNAAVTAATVGPHTIAYSYNSFGEMTQQAIRFQSPADTMYRVTYARDNGGRITTLSEIILTDTTVWAYTYHTSGRLYQVTRNSVLIATYEYDANGNRIELTSQTGIVTSSYDDQDRILTHGSKTFTHTPSGNRMAAIEGVDTTSYSYDGLGNLRRAVLPSNDTIVFAYDARGRRVAKWKNSVPQYKLLYLGRIAPIALLDSADSVVMHFVYGLRPNVPDIMIKNGTRYRLIHDHLGSVRLVLDIDADTVVQRLDYDEYGRITLDTNPGFQPFGFAGGVVDHDLAWTRFGSRDYDPETGRWTSKDPIGLRGGDTNLYSYALNDPINLNDPTGNFPVAVLIPILLNGLSGFASDILGQLLEGRGLACLNFDEAGRSALMSAAITGAGFAWFRTMSGIGGKEGLFQIGKVRFLRGWRLGDPKKQAEGYPLYGTYSILKANLGGGKTFRIEWQPRTSKFDPYGMAHFHLPNDYKKGVKHRRIWPFSGLLIGAQNDSECGCDEEGSN